MTLQTEEVLLDPSNPSAPVQLLISDDQECGGDSQTYLLTYTYAGSEQFSVVKDSVSGVVTIEIEDGEK